MRCCVPFCNNISNNDSRSQGISFHMFPTKKTRRDAWIKALCMTNHFIPLHASVCSKHFSNDNIKVILNGRKRLSKGATPLTVKVCMICLDTESPLSTLSNSNLEEEYKHLTGLSLSDTHVQTLCAGCAQRLRNYVILRDECLKSNQLMAELVARQPVTVENIRKIKQQNHQKNSSVDEIPETEHRNVENETQTGLSALNESIDVKCDISDDILYDIYPNNDNESMMYRNNETGEVNNKHIGNLCTEYENNAMQVNENDTNVETNETVFAQYVGDKIVGDALGNGTNDMQDIIGVSRDGIEMYVRNTDEDTVEIIVVENEPEETELTANEVEKTAVVPGKEKSLERTRVNHGETETNSIPDEERTEEVIVENMVTESAVKVERIETEMSDNEEDTEDSHFLEEITVEKEIQTNRNEAEIYAHQDLTVTKELKASVHAHKELKENEANHLIKIKEEPSTEHTKSVNYNFELKIDNVKREIIDEIVMEEISDRKSDGNGGSELTEKLEKTFECAKCFKTFLEKKSYNFHMKGCSEDNSQHNMKAPGKLVLKFDNTFPKTQAAKVKKKLPTSEKYNFRKRRIDDLSNNETPDRDNKRIKSEVRLKLSFISDSSESVITEMRSQSFGGGRRKFTGKLECEKCDYRCATTKLLNQHMMTHTGEKPYLCHLCEYRCAQKSQLDQHLRTHTGVKPYFCRYCEYRCVQKSQLDQHVRRHTGIKPYSCIYCEYTCVQKTHLNQHIRVHTGNRPFTCKFCGYRFVQKSALVKHLNIHDGDTFVDSDASMKTFKIE